MILLISVAGRVVGSPSSFWDKKDHKKLIPFFSKMGKV